MWLFLKHIFIYGKTDDNIYYNPLELPPYHQEN